MDDSGEREAAGEGHVTRDGMKVAILKHKEDCDLHEKVDKLRLWVAGATALGMFFNGAGLVILAWWLSSRTPAPHHAATDAPALISKAHAETKGSP